MRPMTLEYWATNSILPNRNVLKNSDHRKGISNQGFSIKTLALLNLNCLLNIFILRSFYENLTYDLMEYVTADQVLV